MSTPTSIDWKCICREKILGKIHDENILIMLYKGLRLQITGSFNLDVICPKCGRENTLHFDNKTIEDYSQE